MKTNKTLAQILDEIFELAAKRREEELQQLQDSGYFGPAEYLR